VEPLRERRLQVGDQHLVAVLEQRVEEEALVREQPFVARLGPSQPPVGLREQPSIRDLVDHEEPSRGQVDDRRRDVDHVRPLVDQRPDLPRPHVRRRRELHRRGGVALAQRDGLPLRRTGAHHLVDRRPHVATVAPLA
jgi:hypothetical protein